jgi:uncharacterized membrane protein (DUF106 family)
MSGIVILQIMLITLGMIAFGYIFNKLLGIDREKVSKFREKAMNLQERMRNAQLVGDYQSLREMQKESMELTKDMMKRQFIPMCIRCLVFIGIFTILGFIYSDYSEGLLPFPILWFGSGWAAIYLLFSLGFSLIIYIVRKLYRKATGKEKKKGGMLSDLMNMTSSMQQGGAPSLSDMGQTTPTLRNYEPTLDKQEKNKERTSKESQSSESQSWKDRLQS